MTTTVQQLIENLQQFPDASVVAVKDVDDQEFAIVGFNPGDNTVTIVITDELRHDEEEDEEI